MARIVVLSDLHLSPKHGFFWENWCVARDLANRTNADAVIVNGDLAINGPDSDAEIAFAASALSGLRGRVMPLPGNHDVGDEPPGQDPGQIVNSCRLARWDISFGADRWALEMGDWSLVGVNAQLFGSGLAREHAQDHWLDQQLRAANGRHIGLFLHKPLFLDDPNDDVVSPRCIVPLARARLLEKMQQFDVRLIVSGHLHQFRDRTLDHTRHVWVPAVAFAASQSFGGDVRCGITFLDFASNGVSIAVEQPPGLVSHDLAAIKGYGRFQFLRDMPPSPPPAAPGTQCFPTQTAPHGDPR
jgi:3',5'-cyclic AMP phosphodiesterase CpdA